MSNFTIITKLTDRPVVAFCPSGSSLASLSATGLSGVVESRFTERERPTQAQAVVAAAAQAGAFASAESLKGAGYVNSLNDPKTQHQHHMWAYRGLEPWRDPA
ncbi:hypothetical protein AB0I22_03125 [Streptomyces sp. NPDC050610]|uniref:hypothetical protein n=1 Tax=Streptomyces sp. NPDC050610 TaxID=3157097 RepID=UPI003440E10E